MKITKEKSGCWFASSNLTLEEKEIAIRMPALTKENACLTCLRCAEKIPNDWRLPDGTHYCRSCIVLGRLTEDDYLYYFPPKPFPKTDCLRWQGQLTDYQKEVSDGLIEALHKKRDSLIHAVTGAGKTEMIYEVVAQVINKGGQVCLASPRIDVCIELYKRLSQDFSCEIDLLHGDSEPYSGAPLVVATTHQLLKFYRCFDLILVDEVDAFPYVDNKTLYYAVKTAKKEDGLTIFMTATSTEALDRQVKKGQLRRLTLSRRFHGNPLIVPQTIWLTKLEKKVQSGKIPTKLKKYIDRQLSTEYPLLIFIPDISFGQKITEILRQMYPENSVGFVSSVSLNRLEEVERFRKGNLRILISTTILERGVTFPKVDVFVLLSHHRLFNSSSLIQIAGRVGRSLDRPTGDLFFFHDGLTRAIKKTKQEIRKMNCLGGFR
ncbi:DEAD/DEAH box helicase [Streptococcus halotolerans]|uniref:DEAD/DEAH box helicase n=1 Tax=Streptococcus halotolerans TaxID=1814128 RepID=UPI000788BE57|nr:DEAD/DEAH box helicase [Streptococcus halotolerans]